MPQVTNVTVLTPPGFQRHNHSSDSTHLEHSDTTESTAQPVIPVERPCLQGFFMTAAVAQSVYI